MLDDFLGPFRTRSNGLCQSFKLCMNGLLIPTLIKHQQGLFSSYLLPSYPSTHVHGQFCQSFHLCHREQYQNKNCLLPDTGEYLDAPPVWRKGFYVPSNMSEDQQHIWPVRYKVIPKLECPKLHLTRTTEIQLLNPRSSLRLPRLGNEKTAFPLLPEGTILSTRFLLAEYYHRFAQDEHPENFLHTS